MREKILLLPPMHREICWCLEIRDEYGRLTPYRYLNGMFEEYDDLEAKALQVKREGEKLYGVEVHMDPVPTRYWWPLGLLTVPYTGLNYK